MICSRSSVLVLLLLWLTVVNSCAFAQSSGEVARPDLLKIGQAYLKRLQDVANANRTWLLESGANFFLNLPKIEEQMFRDEVKLAGNVLLDGVKVGSNIATDGVEGVSSILNSMGNNGTVSGLVEAAQNMSNSILTDATNGASEGMENVSANLFKMFSNLRMGFGG